MRRKKNTVIAAGLSLVLACSVVGCGDGKKMEAEINPDTPVEEVAFPLKEKAELSFITNAPATSTQDPNQREIFKRLEKQTNVHIDWQTSLQIRKILRWLNLEIFRTGFSMRG